MKFDELFVLEWSVSQNAFHIQLLEMALEANQRRFSDKPDDMFDWVPLYVGTYRECEIVARHNEYKLNRKERIGVAREWTH